MLTRNHTLVELETGDKIYLKSFESSKVDEFIHFVKDHQLLHELPGGEKTVIHATGGGAYKYHELFEKEFSG